MEENQIHTHSDWMLHTSIVVLQNTCLVLFFIIILCVNWQIEVCEWKMFSMWSRSTLSFSMSSASSELKQAQQKKKKEKSIERHL